MNKKISKIAYIFFIFALIILVAFDQLTKIYARSFLNPASEGYKGSFTLIKNVLSLTYLENRGCVWGAMQGKVNILAFVSLFLLIILIYAFIKLPKIRKYSALLWVDLFMIAGAIGNSIDRFCFGYVTDFIYFELIDFPIFNFADCCITVAAFLTVILAFTKYRSEDFSFFALKSNSGSKERMKTEENGKDCSDN